MKVETEEEKKARNERVKLEQLDNIISNGIRHDVWIRTEIGLPGMTEPIDPVVQMANDGDPFYIQTFRTSKAVDEFIKQLEEAKAKAWPSEGTK